MKSKFIFTLSFLLFFCILFSIQSCENLVSTQNTRTSVNIKLDLSSIIGKYRNQGREYVLKIVAYDATSYNTSEKIENLPIVDQANNTVDTSGIVQTTLQVPIGSSVIFEAKLVMRNTVTNEESQEALYYGKSDVIKTKPTNNKVSIVLGKTQLGEDLNISLKNEFLVQFNTHDGSSVDDQKVEKNKTATEPISPTKTGYTFDGWYTSSDEGTTLETEFDFTAPITSDITLYAKWIANTYSVTFDKNAQNATGTMENQNFTYDKETTLLSNSFSNPGYRFSVWNTKADGRGEVYNNNQSVKNLTSEKDGTITLYAQWTLEGNYLITYNLDEGTNNPNNPLEYNVESATIVLQAPSREGYIFEGWENEFGNVITEITKGSTGDITLTAQWTPRTDISYTVKHYKQNVEDDEYTFYEAEEKTGTTDTLTSSTIKSYEGFTAKGFEEQTILPDGTTVVEIYYDRKSYTVSFDSKAGNPESYESQTLKYEQTATEPLSPTKTGYTFDGWYTSSDNGTTLETEFDFTTPITSDITLYAKWIANKSIITITLPNTNDPEINLQQTTNGDMVTFTANAGFESYAWYIDGTKQTDETTSTFILDTSSMDAANYNVMVMVTDSTQNYYSATAYLELKK